jgi:hypothetical protein
VALGGDPWGLGPRLRRLMVLETALFAVLLVAGLGAPGAERAFLVVAFLACWTAIVWAALLVPPRPQAPVIGGHPVLRWGTCRRVVLSVACAGLFAVLSAISSEASMRIAGLGMAAAVGSVIWSATAGRVRLTQDGIERLRWTRARPAVSWSAVVSVTPNAYISWSPTRA